MALADICGFDKHMKPNATTVDALGDEMFNQCRNMSNNYELAMPPFTNVTIPFNSTDSNPSQKMCHKNKPRFSIIVHLSVIAYSQPKISTR